MKDKQTKRYLTIGAVVFGVIAASILFFLTVYNIKAVVGGILAMLNILRPFIYGCIIAYILRPMCSFFEHMVRYMLRPFKRMHIKTRQKISAVTSIILSFAVVILAIVLLMNLVIPALVDCIKDLFNSATVLIDDLQKNGLSSIVDDTFIGNWIKSNETINKLFDALVNSVDKFLADFDIDVIQGIFGNEASGNFVNNIISMLSSGIVFVVEEVVNAFIGIIVAIYLLVDRRRVARKVEMVLHGGFRGSTVKKIVREAKFVDSVFSGYLSGTILDAIFIGVICFILCSLLGLEYAALVSVLVGVTNVIPYFGPFIGAIPSALLILAGGGLFQMIEFVIMILILQQIEGNIIAPRILGNSTGLSSFWVLFSIMLFGGLFGVIGMIIAVPLFSVIYRWCGYLLKFCLARHGKQELLQLYESERPEQEKKKNFIRRFFARFIPEKHDDDDHTAFRNAIDKDTQNEEIRRSAKKAEKEAAASVKTENVTETKDEPSALPGDD